MPLEPVVTAGYGIVGYTTFDFAQCYASSTVATAIKAFLTDHYGITSYTVNQTNNGFVSLAKSHASNFLPTIKANILANTNGWNDDIEDTTVCKGLKGR